MKQNVVKISIVYIKIFKHNFKTKIVQMLHLQHKTIR